MTKTELKNLIKECLREEMRHSKRVSVSESFIQWAGLATKILEDAKPYSDVFELAFNRDVKDAPEEQVRAARARNDYFALFQAAPKAGFERNFPGYYFVGDEEYSVLELAGDRFIPVPVEDVEAALNGNIHENIRRRANESYRRRFR